MPGPELAALDLEQTFGLTEGHTYHGEMSLDQILFMRSMPGFQGSGRLRGDGSQLETVGI